MIARRHRLDAAGGVCKGSGKMDGEWPPMAGDQLDIQWHSSILPARQPLAAWPFSEIVQYAGMDITDVAVIGAGPYGLSVAAHLRFNGIRHRIFGQPLLPWR